MTARPSRSLPPRPSLEVLKKQAKAILRGHGRGDAEACAALRLLDRFAETNDAGLLSATIGLQECQHALARDYGFRSWAAIRQQALSGGGGGPYLHVHCGDTSADALRESGVPGEVVVWRDPVLEGPIAAACTDEAYRQLRARWFADRQYARSYEGALQGLTARHRKLEEAPRYAEVVLWFDACLFDQTIMIHVMDKLARIDTGNAVLSLICIGEHHAFERFRGLGELSPEQTAALWPTRHPITDAEFALARRAWRALCSEDPREIEDVITGVCTPLPYLAEALERHLEEYPSLRNGLSRMQRQALDVVAAGESRLGAIFARVSALEERPFFGDTTLWGCLDELATTAVPLLQIDGPGPLDRPLWDPIEEIGRWTVTVTSAGRDVLAGQEDHVRLNGLDRWLGGVHLRGSAPAWRWDPQTRRLRSSRS